MCCEGGTSDHRLVQKDRTTFSFHQEKATLLQQSNADFDPGLNPGKPGAMKSKKALSQRVKGISASSAFWPSRLTREWSVSRCLTGVMLVAGISVLSVFWLSCLAGVRSEDKSMTLVEGISAL